MNKKPVMYNAKQDFYYHLLSLYKKEKGSKLVLLMSVWKIFSNICFSETLQNVHVRRHQHCSINDFYCSICT